MDLIKVKQSYTEKTGKLPTFKSGKLSTKFLKYNLNLLKEGKTNIYADSKKFFNPNSNRLINFKFTAKGKITKDSKRKFDAVQIAANYKYVTKGSDVVKVPASERGNIPYLEQKFNVKMEIGNINKLSKDGFTFQKTIPPGQSLALTLKIKFDTFYSGLFQSQFTFTRNVIESSEELQDPNYIMGLIHEYWGSEIVEPLEVRNVIVDYVTQTSEQTLKMGAMGLYESKPVNISAIFNNIIYTNTGGNCIQKHLENLWGKRTSNKQKKLIQPLKTIDDLHNFCEKYYIKMIAYDIKGNVIKANYPTKDQKKFANLIFVAYNQHLYPLINGKLKKAYFEKQKLTRVGDAHTAFLNKMSEGILGSIFKFDSYEERITAFSLGDEVIFENEDYDTCLGILELFGLKDMISWNTTLKNIVSVIEKAYLDTDNIESFWLNHADFSKGGYIYKDVDAGEITNDEYITIDKNKSYSHALKSLDYLISVDMKTDHVVPYQNQELIEHNLYLVKVKKSSILLPTTNIYDGKHLIYCLNNHLRLNTDFEIIEFVNATRHKNLLSKMINDIYERVDHKLAKKMVNVFIGKFERANNVNTFLKPIAVLDSEEYKTVSQNTKVCVLRKGKFWLELEAKEQSNLTNRKPIAIQVKDQSRRTLFEFLLKNEITNKDVVQVKTDSITFKKSNDKYLDYLSETLEGWKLEDHNLIIRSHPFNYDKLNMNKSITKVEMEDVMAYGGTTLIEGDAGNGKSHFIRTKLVPRCKEEGHSYIILTPSHEAAKEYRQHKLNVRVIQGYINGKIPDADHIIVDEIGMVCSKDWEVIVKCVLLKKHVSCFGDFQQLAPPAGKKVTRKFLKSIFETMVLFTENYRNNFTKEYYNKLKYCPDRKWLHQEVLLHSQDKYTEGTQIVAYTNVTRQMYNKNVCDKLNIAYDINDTNQISIHPLSYKNKPTIVCKSNLLRILGIYNGFMFTINSHCYKAADIGTGNELYFKIVDGDIEHVLKYKTIKKYFQFSFCKTLHGVQGKSLEKIMYAPEDIQFITNEAAYTFISRIKQNVDCTNKIKYELL